MTPLCGYGTTNSAPAASPSTRVSTKAASNPNLGALQYLAILLHEFSRARIGKLASKHQIEYAPCLRRRAQRSRNNNVRIDNELHRAALTVATSASISSIESSPNLCLRAEPRKELNDARACMERAKSTTSSISIPDTLTMRFCALPLLVAMAGSLLESTALGAA